MRTPAIFALLATAALFCACTQPEFSRVRRQDSGPDTNEPKDGPPAGADHPTDVVDDGLICEAAGDVVCTPAACGPVCHTRQGSAGAGAPCTVFSGANPSRYDDCSPGNVCLTDGFGAFHCFGLCRNSTDCDAGRACTARVLEGGTSIRACDPPYRSCSSTSQPCCDPVANSGCDSGQYCYLIPPQASGSDSWTVCDYLTGGGLPGQACTTSRDCLQGFACYFATSSSATGDCRQVCNPADASACPVGTCTVYGKQWGVCSS